MALDPISTMMKKMQAKRAQGLGQGPQLPTPMERQPVAPAPRVVARPVAQPVTQLQQFAQPAPAPTMPALAPQSPLEAFAAGLPTQVPVPPVETPRAPLPAEASVGPVEGVNIPPAVLRAAEEIQRRDPTIRFGRAVDEAARILGLG